MHDDALVGLVIDRGGDDDRLRGDLDHALVARLAAALRVEHGPVEHDAAALVHRDDRRRALAAIGIGAKQQIGGHGRVPSARISGKCADRRQRRSGRPRVLK